MPCGAFRYGCGGVCAICPDNEAETRKAPRERGLDSDCVPVGTVPEGCDNMTEITDFVQVCIDCERVFVGQGLIRPMPCGCGYGIAATPEEVARAIKARRNGK